MARLLTTTVWVPDDAPEPAVAVTTLSSEEVAVSELKAPVESLRALTAVWRFERSVSMVLSAEDWFSSVVSWFSNRVNGSLSAAMISSTVVVTSIPLPSPPSELDESRALRMSCPIVAITSDESLVELDELDDELNRSDSSEVEESRELRIEVIEDVELIQSPCYSPVDDPMAQST